MSPAVSLYFENSRATEEPFVKELAREDERASELTRRIAGEIGTVSPEGRLGVDLVRRMRESWAGAVSFSWLRPTTVYVFKSAAPSFVDPLQRMKNEEAIRLLDAWMSDASGYDERVWPVVKKAIEDHRLSERKRFDE